MPKKIVKLTSWVLLLMVQKSPTTTWDVFETLVNNGISTTNLN